jgi:hypothetical protein
LGSYLYVFNQFGLSSFFFFFFLVTGVIPEKRIGTTDTSIAQVCCRGIQRYSQEPSIAALSEEKPKYVIIETME